MTRDKQIKVKITLDGVQEFKAQLKGVSVATDQLGKDFKNLGSALADSAKAFAAIGAAAVTAGIASYGAYRANKKRKTALAKK